MQTAETSKWTPKEQRAGRDHGVSLAAATVATSGIASLATAGAALAEEADAAAAVRAGSSLAPVACLVCPAAVDRVAERTLGMVSSLQGGLSAGTLAFSLTPIVLYGVFTVIRQNVCPAFITSSTAARRNSRPSGCLDPRGQKQGCMPIRNGCEPVSKAARLS